MTKSYLSRVEINPRKRGARNLLSSPQAMHAAVESSFPPSARELGSRVLWRLDVNEFAARLFVVSPSRPDFTHLVEQAGWLTGEPNPWLTKPYDRLLDRLTEGQSWGFRFAGNPVRQGRTGSGESKKFGHVTAEQQLHWFEKRTNPNGFRFAKDDIGQDAVEVVSRSTLRFRRGNQGAPVVIRQAVFEGVLEVTDPDLLRTALTFGIGRSKAYGCGLLTLAPVRGLESP